MLQQIEDLCAQFAGFVWGIPMVVILIGTGLFFTIYLGGLQFRAFAHAVKVVMGKYDNKKDPGEITHFQALCSALSATVGLGNIAGVAIAIHIGGPGATFWMISAGLVGMIVKFTESTLAVKYRKIDENGVVHGGPMHYIELGLGKMFKPLSIWYCLGIIFATFGALALFQSNQVAEIVNMSFGIDRLGTGIVLAVLTAIVIIGSIKKIAAVSSKLIPLMAGIYIIGSLFVIFSNFQNIPDMFIQIVGCALTGGAVGGACAGLAIQTVLIQGVRRACFSNEAGLGTSAIAHSAAKTEYAVREGVVAMLEPFVDTVIICTMTALVIISSGLWQEDLNGIALTSNAFDLAIPGFGKFFLPVAVFLFAYSSLISWYYYGERSWDYLFKGKVPLWSYQIIYCGLIVVGAIWSLDPVINFSDGVMGLLVVPNLIALLLMAPRVKKFAKDYFDRLKAGEF